MIVDSNRFGSGEEAAEIAAVLTERGLGGDGADLDARLDQFRRDRSPRSSSARDLARRWAQQVASVEKPKGAGDLSTGLMLAFAFPDRVAKNRGNGSFVLANGRGAAVEQTSALARAPYIAVGELTGTAASGRILLAAPITQDEIEHHFADQIESTEEISFDRSAMALRARRKRTLHAVTLSEAPIALSPSAETAKIFADGLIAAGLDKLPWSKALKQWRDRVMFLRKAEGESWPDLSDAALVAQSEAWLVPALYDKTSLKEFSAGDLSDAVMGLLPWDLRARLEREAPTHFEAPTGTMLAIDYEAEQGPTIAVRLQELFGLNTHPSIAKRRRAAGAGAVVAGAAPGAGDARSARLLARQLCRGPFRSARPLSPPPLAGRPRQRRADPPGQAARDVKGHSSARARDERGAHSTVHGVVFAIFVAPRLPAGKWPVNTSLILFAKMAAFPGAVSRGLAAGVVISAGFQNRLCGVMRNIMIFAAIMVGLGLFMAQTADRMTSTPALAKATPQKSVSTQTVAQASGRSVSIPRDARGHFSTEGRIDGQRIDFMVDTGASVVALNEKSAARFGLRPSRCDYNATVSTANGTIKAARTRIAMMEVGGLIVRDVDAMVLPDEALSENLLGMSFLSRLKRFEYANGRMVLEQ